MKEYIKQFYTEGLATTFYQKPIAFIEKRIKNKQVIKIIKELIKVFYTILVLVFAGYVFYKKAF